MTQPPAPLPEEPSSSETLDGDQIQRAIVDAIEQYISDGHPVSLDEVQDPDAPAVRFQLQRDIFEGYLQVRRLEPDG